MSSPNQIRFPGRVAWSDTDTAGVAFFGAYARWVEYAEAELWRRAGLPLAELFDRYEVWMPRVEFRCRYRRPLRYDEPFEVRLRVADHSSRTVTYAFEIVRSETEDEAARGHLKVAFVDRSDFTGRDLPGEVWNRLQGAGYLPEVAPAAR